MTLLQVVSVCNQWEVSTRMAGRTFNVNELNSDIVHAMLEEIPSDEESCVSESESEDEEENIEHGTNAHLNGEEHACEEPPVERNIEANEAEAVVQENIIWLRDHRHTNAADFSSEVGPNIDEDVTSPVQVFECLFPPELIESIVYQTNLYATQKMGGSTSFQPTNSQEIKKFFAINLLMGLKKLPSYTDYWSSDPMMRDNYISSIMPRNRFSWLISNVHINDNSKQPKKGEESFDKLYKVRPLLTFLKNTFLSSYKPTKAQAVDESMIRFKGRSSLKQYMPQKPIKRGYKVWIRANDNAYISEFDIYTGKIGTVIEKRLGERVVKSLTRELEGKNHEVYFDNYFSSVPLMKYLKDHGVHACGTVRKGRVGFPTDFENEKGMQRGEFQFRCSEEGLLALMWKDRKGILFLSNFHNVDDVTIVSRKNKDGSETNITCPVLVKDYNAHMGFVDKADMLKTCYEIDRKSKKWWHRIMWHFLDVTVVNANIIFKEMNPEDGMTLKKFRLAVIAGLVGAARPTPPKRTLAQVQNKFKPYVPREKRTDQAAHMPVQGTSRRCAMCSTAKNPHRTKWACQTCSIGLCMSKTKNCFAEYHQ